MGRLPTQRQNLLEEGDFVRRAEMKQAPAGALDEQGNGDVAGRDDRIIGFARNAKPGELRRHDPAGVGRVRHQHDRAAACPEAAKRLGGFLEGHESIVDDAPDVAQNDFVSAREIGQSAHQASHALNRPFGRLGIAAAQAPVGGPGRIGSSCCVSNGLTPSRKAWRRLLNTTDGTSS
jgi:hypothetical protein